MALIPDGARKIVTDVSNNYFSNNRLMIAEDIPTEGYFYAGDIIINQYAYGNAIGWICYEEGEPGEWDLISSAEGAMINWNNILQKPTSYTPKLGVTSTTAYRGDYGNTAYNHSQSTHAPSNAQKNSDITKAEIEAKLIGTITTHNHKYAGSSSVGGSATSAEKLSSAKTISLSGAVTGSTTFDGSSNKTITTSIVIPTSGAYWNGYTKVNTDGVMEIGKYIDFHNTNTDTSDYSIRLQCNTTGPCVITLPSSTGTIATIDDINDVIGSINTLLEDIVG